MGGKLSICSYEEKHQTYTIKRRPSVRVQTLIQRQDRIKRSVVGENTAQYIVLMNKLCNEIEENPNNAIKYELNSQTLNLTKENLLLNPRLVSVSTFMDSKMEELTP